MERIRSTPLVLLGALLGLSLLGLLAPRAASQAVLGGERVKCDDGRVPISGLPFTIDSCGSYFLTKCLIGSSGQDGITIDADDVTLDLNGFTLTGVPGSLDGVTVTAGKRNARVCNGSVRGWGGSGVDASGASGVRLFGLTAGANGNLGLGVGLGGIVEDCTANGNDVGIAIGFGGVASGSTATNNGSIGIFGFIGATPTGCTVRGCTARGNGVGIQVGDSSVVAGCAVTLNATAGVLLGPASVVEGCAVSINGAEGIVANDSLVRGNAARGNGAADIDAPGSTVIENH